MAYLGKVMYLTQAQYATLQSTGTITIDGVTYTYSDNDLYLVPSGEDLPSYTAADEGKVLKIVSGVPTWVTP